MKENLKKYLFIIPLLIVLLIDDYLLSKESKFYTHNDIDILKDSTFYLVLFLEVLFLGILLLPRFLAIQKIKELFHTLLIFVMALFIFFSSFQSVFLSIYLYFNRQHNDSELVYSYKIITKKASEGIYNLSWLYNYNNNEILLKDIEVEYADFIKLKEQDTVDIKFQKGRFGIKHSPEYFK